MDIRMPKEKQLAVFYYSCYEDVLGMPTAFKNIL